MAGSDHFSAHAAKHDSEQTAARNSRYGLFLCAIYFLLYAGYMLLNAFRPAVMDVVVFAGVNLATTYGLGLIAAALLLALVYGWLCRAPVSPREDRA
jgi:uncharacterized membrane protein (DUF485 family)